MSNFSEEPRELARHSSDVVTADRQLVGPNARPACCKHPCAGLEIALPALLRALRAKRSISAASSALYDSQPGAAIKIAIHRGRASSTGCSEPLAELAASCAAARESACTELPRGGGESW